MNFKKLGIAGVLGFFTMGLVGVVTFELFHKGHFASIVEKYPDVITFPPNMAPAMLGGIFYMFVMVYIYDRMGVDSLKAGYHRKVIKQKSKKLLEKLKKLKNYGKKNSFKS